MEMLFAAVRESLVFFLTKPSLLLKESASYSEDGSSQFWKQSLHYY